MKRGSLDFRPGDTVLITSISDDQPDSFQIEAFVTLVRSGPLDSLLLEESLGRMFPMMRGNYQLGIGDLGTLVCDSDNEDHEWFLINQKKAIQVIAEKL